MKIRVAADPATCGSLFDPVGIRTFTAPCDIIRRTLSQQAYRYEKVDAPAGSPVVLTVLTVVIGLLFVPETKDRDIHTL